MITKGIGATAAIGIASALLLIGCRAAGPGIEPGMGSPQAPGGCAILQSSDWRAWVNAMPGPSVGRVLHVNGKVTFPAAGYQASLELGPIAETYPLTVTVQMQVQPPAGPAAQTLADATVQGNWPIEGEVGSVTVMCGGRVIGRVSPVETAH